MSESPAAAPAGATPVVEVVGVSKRYGPVEALKAVSITMRSGEIVGLIGANGAGKSTLVKVISGLVVPDSGEVRIDGEALGAFHSVKSAQAGGVALVAQELSLIEGASVAENIYMGNLPTRRGLVSRRAMRQHAAGVLESLGADVSPVAPIENCTAVQQRLVMVAAALSREARVLILDEPTAALPIDEADHVLNAARQLRALGNTVVFVSHRLNEVKELCDRAIAMRDGEVVRELGSTELDVDRMVELVSGAAPATLSQARRTARPTDGSRALITARGLQGRRIRDLELEVQTGEILGIAGLVGSGRSELLRLLAGVQAPAAGELVIRAGEQEDGLGHHRARVGYIEEDRARNMFWDLDVAGNLSLPSLKRFTRGGMIRRREELAAVREMIGQVNLKGNVESEVDALSGGNKQKVLLGRWLMSKAQVLLLDEPTVGIDVGARAEIQGLLRDFVDAGGSVVVAIADPAELLSISDRVVVLREGRVTETAVKPFDEQAIVAASYAEPIDGASPAASEG